MPSIPFALPPFSLAKRLTSTVPPQPGSPPPGRRFSLTGPMRSGSVPLTTTIRRISPVSSRELVSATEAPFTENLRKHNDVFSIVQDNNGEGKIGEHLKFNPSLKTYEARTEAVAHVIKCLGNLTPGIRNELYPVTLAFGVPPFFSLERAAAPYFGIKAYGVHMNEYVEIDGEKFVGC